MPKPKKPAAPKLNALLAETLSSASSSRDWCIACALHKTCKTPFMKPFVPGDWTGKLLIIGEAPGADEDDSGRPFTGPSGELLQTLWREAGFADSDVALHNANRCRPPKNRTPTMRQVRACRAFVLRVLDQLRPQFVLGVGGTALRSLTNSGVGSIGTMRGKRLQVPGGVDGVYSVFVTYHPSAILRGATHLRSELLGDLKRLANPIEVYPEIDTPRGRLLAVDTEFDPTGRVLTVAVADRSSAVGADDPEGQDFYPCTKLLAEREYLVGHNVYEDMRVLRQTMDLPERWITGERVLDSVLLARMVDENRGKGAYRLETLLSSFANVEPWKQLTEKYSKTDATLWPSHLREERCRLDAWASYRIAEHFYKNLRKQKALVEYTHRIAATLNRMSLVGAFVDLASFESMKEKLAVEVEECKDLLRGKAAQAGMAEFVPTNDGHLRDLLYTKLGLPVLNRTTKTKQPAVDLVTLKNLGHEVADLLVRYSKADKLYSVNGTGLDDLLKYPGQVGDQAVGWLSFRVNPLGARTGRRSSSNPNSQNWPTSVRNIIRSRYPGGVIGDFDYRRLEVVLIAWIAGDDRLFEAFTNGRGYLDIARDLWRVDVEEGTAQYKATKSVVLGVNYNLQAPKMARELWNKANVRFSADYREHEKQTERVRSRYLRQHRPLVDYMDARERELLDSHCVVALTGRVRHLPLTDGRDTPKYWHFLNQAINFPVQSLASEITGSALVDTETAILAEEGLSYTEYYDYILELNRFYLTNEPNRSIMHKLPLTFLVNEVHDSIVADMPPEKVKRDSNILTDCMRNVKSLRKLCPAFTLDVLATDSKVGPRWGQRG